MTGIPVRLFIVAVVFVGILCLQWFFSTRASRWPGLLLPLLSFLFGLLFPLSFAVPPEGITFSTVLEILLVWVIGNIPTFILLCIYFSCRNRQEKKRQIDNMKIRDLH